MRDYPHRARVLEQQAVRRRPMEWVEPQGRGWRWRAWAILLPVTVVAATGVIAELVVMLAKAWR